MAELENKKFKYRKDRMDNILIGIILFSLLCVGLIVYGTRYFDGYNQVRDSNDRNQINELVENRAILEQQINEYLNEENPASN